MKNRNMYLNMFLLFFFSEFLERLEVCGLNPVEVAKCFVTKNEGFSIYTQYCTNYPR